MGQLFRVTPVLATSDDPGASRAIADFATSDRPWLVAVRMVSEGVDIPRLRVGVYATTTTTELFFRQAVGRFVRWLPGVGRQAAYLFIPDDPRLRSGAERIAEARRHSLRRRDVREREVSVEGEWDALVAEQDGGHEEQLSLFTVISAVATDAVDHDGEGADEPLQADDDPHLMLDLGAPPPLAGPTAVESTVGGQAVGRQAVSLSRMEVKSQLREENATIAKRLARATGWSHAQVNAELNRLAGVGRVTEATVAELERRLGHGRRWLERVEPVLVQRSSSRQP
jgi:hypothetical protein